MLIVVCMVRVRVVTMPVGLFSLHASEVGGELVSFHDDAVSVSGSGIDCRRGS